MGKRAPGGRTMTITYRSDRIVIREGLHGELEFKTGIHTVVPESKTFEAATNEARRWLLENAGKMKGNYERD